MSATTPPTISSQPNASTVASVAVTSPTMQMPPRITKLTPRATNQPHESWMSSRVVSIDVASDLRFNMIITPTELVHTRTLMLMHYGSNHHLFGGAYSNCGAASKACLLAPGRMNFPACNLICDTGIATSWRSTPRNPPAPMMAYETALSGAMMMSSMIPMRSFFSLYTAFPRTWRVALQP